MNIQHVLGAALALCLSFSLDVAAQISEVSHQPVAGKPCPDFILKEVEDYPDKMVSQATLKGKPFILDFFSTGCVACFASFSTLNKFNKEFSGRITYILVGRDDRYIRSAYQTFKERQYLKLPHAYDTTTFLDFGVNGVPLLIWVGADGIVQAITSSSDVTEDNLTAFSNGQSFPYQNAFESLALAQTQNTKKPFLIDSIAGIGNNFLQRSLIAAWKPEMGNESQLNVQNYIKLKIPLQIIGWPLSALYKFAYTNNLADWSYGDTAYYGKYRYAPIYELSDSSKFQFSWGQINNVFCYSQILPENGLTPGKMLQVMKNDLWNAFGYDAGVELREMPYLRLVARNGQSIRSTGKKTVEKVFIDGVDFQHGSLDNLISAIVYKAELISRDLPLINETGIDYPITIKFKAAMTDLPDVQRALRPYGLEMIPGLKKMNVLVIRDGKGSTSRLADRLPDSFRTGPGGGFSAQ